MFQIRWIVYVVEFISDGLVNLRVIIYVRVEEAKQTGFPSYSLLEVLGFTRVLLAFRSSNLPCIHYFTTIHIMELSGVSINGVIPGAIVSPFLNNLQVCCCSWKLGVNRKKDNIYVY